MLYKTRKFWTSLIITTALFLVSSIFATSQNIYGWDTWTLPLVVCSIVVILGYFETKRIWLVVLLGVISALAGLCRIPNFAIVFFVSAIFFFWKGHEYTLRFKTKLVIIYLVASAISTLLLLVLLYGSTANYVNYLHANSIADHETMGLINSYITSSLILFMQGPALFFCCYFVLDKAQYKSQLVFVSICIALICILCYSCLYYHAISFAYESRYILSFVIVIILAIYSFNRHTFQTLLAITLLSCIPFIGSNTGVGKFVALPLIPILYILIRYYLNRTMVIFSILSYMAVILSSYYGVRHTSSMDVGLTEANYEVTLGLAKGIKTVDAKGRTMDAIASDAVQYNNYEKIVLRNDTSYVYEYILQSYNNYLRYKFHGGDDNDAQYVAWVENEINNGGDKVAIWRFGECKEPSLMTDALDKLCTKAKVWRLDDCIKQSSTWAHLTDTYTIYIKKPENHE